MNFSSKLIEDAVAEISRLPGIGKKTALRLTLHLLKQKEPVTTALTDALIKLRHDIQYCSICHNVSDKAVCSICEGIKRDKSLICVVEDLPDVLAIENTNQYAGLYHILGGVISPIQGIGPDEINIASLMKRIESPPSGQAVVEVILALPATMEGDTTSFFITRKLKDRGIKVSTIARGIPVGSELEYTDEITLGRSILSRIKYSAE
ncbi:recombination mediator RecR [Cyclobacterium sp. SYSU L10401]|uniref:recombination mediator RecR n=1 Tax=Cyclobacterium sp. SYSU L10401 TaxID=2678657 RepID=UPI0013D58598|nr:recombination mediator RecR [Cyclobacterium sp. SYSU L10401]